MCLLNQRAKHGIQLCDLPGIRRLDELGGVLVERDTAFGALHPFFGFGLGHGFL